MILGIGAMSMHAAKTLPTIHSTFYFAVAALALAGCDKGASPWNESSVGLRPARSISMNDLRKEIGLFPIGDNWSLYRFSKECDDWVVKRGSGNAKRVFFDSDDHPTHEQDYLYSGNTFTRDHESSSENVTMTYNFNTKLVELIYSGADKRAEQIVEDFHKRWSFKKGIHGQYQSTNVPAAVQAVKQIGQNWPTGFW